MYNYFFSKIALLFFLSSFSNLFAFSYSHVSNGPFSSIHVLIVNPNEEIIRPVKATGEPIARETVVALAQREGACAAVNGGFWKSDGQPAGILKIAFEWLGMPIKPRGAIGWSEGGRKAIFDQVLTNKSIDSGEIEVLPASFPPRTSVEEWQETEHIVGGAPLLISRGKKIEDYTSEQTVKSFLFHRHPRTAVGIRENGDWVFVVVDGRFLGVFGGMTIDELAELMLQLGCIEALNLDGGSSSTMVIGNKVVNTPCGCLEEGGKQVTPVSDAILIFK